MVCNLKTTNDVYLDAIIANILTELSKERFSRNELLKLVEEARRLYRADKYLFDDCYLLLFQYISDFLEAINSFFELLERSDITKIDPLSKVHAVELAIEIKGEVGEWRILINKQIDKIESIKDKVPKLPENVMGSYFDSLFVRTLKTQVDLDTGLRIKKFFNL
jgi:hypothetical protein